MAADDPRAVPAVPEQALPDEQALALAQQLLDEGRAFAAHEVLEASWKALPRDWHEGRRTWQGWAQVCVGVTHLQRGNLIGAARLLRRGADNLGQGPVAETARRAAQSIDDGRPELPTITLPGSGPRRPEPD